MLLITLVTFSVSYLARFVWDEWLHKSLKGPFAYNMVQLAIFLVFDFMPFFSIFTVHYRNFKE